MAIIFGPRPTDGEVDGAAPADFTEDGTYTFGTFEIDDAEYYSGTKSIKTIASGGTGMFRRDESGGFDTDPVIIAVKMPTASEHTTIYSMDATGDYVGTNIIINLQLEATTQNIEYKDATQVWIDTGYNWSAGWNKFKFIHDCGNDQFDAWLGETKIIENGTFRYTATSVKAIHMSGKTSGNGTAWWDIIQIGEQCTITPAQAGPMSGGVTI